MPPGNSRNSFQKRFARAFDHCARSGADPPQGGENSDTRVEIDEFVISPLGPTPRRFIIFARKDAHGSGDRHVNGVVKADPIFPIQTS